MRKQVTLLTKREFNVKSLPEEVSMRTNKETKALLKRGKNEKEGIRKDGNGKKAEKDVTG